MDATSKLIARKMLKLRIHESKGMAFQRLFEQVMGYANAGFIPIKPYGRAGDRKNDGAILKDGKYFQVYAPEDPESAGTAQSAAKKALGDFVGLKKSWNNAAPIRDFRFVFNDEYRGCPPDLSLALTKIANDHGITTGPMLAKDLEAAAMALQDDQLLDIIGGIPMPSGPLSTVDFGVLREVIQHVLTLKAPLPIEGILEAPDFDEKIKFNGLSQKTSTLLRYASYQRDAVDDYFSTNSTYAKQQVRDHLSGLYGASRERLKPLLHDEDFGDLVFLDILQAAMPSRTASSVLHQQAAIQEATLVVMAYYFEACDIFESPNASS